MWGRGIGEVFVSRIFRKNFNLIHSLDLLRHESDQSPVTSFQSLFVARASAGMADLKAADLWGIPGGFVTATEALISSFPRKRELRPECKRIVDWLWDRIPLMEMSEMSEILTSAVERGMQL